MIRVRVQIGGEIQEFVREQRAKGKAADAAMKKSLDVITRTLQGPLQQELVALTPGPVKLPIQWTKSRDGKDRQRKAFFATKGFGHGIPYVRRSPGLMGSWRLRKLVTRAGNLITATNDAPAYKYVVEDPADPAAWQRFHRNTGWPNSGQVDDVFERVADVAETRIADAWIDYWRL